MKEGLSLFGVVNRTCTPLGKILLRQWLLRPSRELDVIKARQDGIECLLREENSASRLHAKPADAGRPAR